VYSRAAAPGDLAHTTKTRRARSAWHLRTYCYVSRNSRVRRGVELKAAPAARVRRPAYVNCATGTTGTTTGHRGVGRAPHRDVDAADARATRCKAATTIVVMPSTTSSSRALCCASGAAADGRRRVSGVVCGNTARRRPRRRERWERRRLERFGRDAVQACDRLQFASAAAVP
jgi:hypothetical protein